MMSINTDDVPCQFHSKSLHVLSMSDEAFIIFVLVNASPRWMAEIGCTEKRYVGTTCDSLVMVYNLILAIPNP